MSKRICVFGDSIALGACDHEGGGWVARLRKYLEINGYDYDVYNLGISGDTTDDLLERFGAEAGAREPEIIIFAIGVNDSSYRQPLNGSYVPLNKFKANLEILKQKANKFTNKVIFVGITKVDENKTAPIPWNIDANYRNKDIKEYNQAIKEFCEKNNLLFTPIYDLLDKEDLEDGLHPNSEGHEKIFQRVKDFLIKNKIIN
jgi:lysophospholipase L1-like esterase